MLAIGYSNKLLLLLLSLPKRRSLAPFEYPIASKECPISKTGTRLLLALLFHDPDGIVNKAILQIEFSFLIHWIFRVGNWIFKRLCRFQ